MRILTFLLLYISSHFLLSCTASDSRPLFNGKDLSGWQQLNGKADYFVEEGQIVGVTKQGTPNSFLCTEEIFGDFILELEVKVDSRINSGVQIRSNSSPEYQAARVHGYQVEIDPSSRAWSGGIYEEGGRAWLYPLSRNPEGQQAFKQNEWNHYRIEAVGNRIRSWINDIPCSNLLDDKTARGFIALQVHSIGGPEQEGLQVRWRNIQIQTEDLARALLPENKLSEFNYIPNHISKREAAEGWKLLWDGETTEGWRSGESEDFPSKGWYTKDGVFSVIASGGSESAEAGDIVTREKFADFELQLDFMLTDSANSGIKYYVDTDINQGIGSEIGLEFQLIDDTNHPDALKGRDGNHSLGSLYDMITARNLSEADSDDKRYKGNGTWNRARIVSRAGHVEHWLNDIKLVEYERGSQAFQDLVGMSKYKKWPNFGELPEGHILLQEHGHTAHFQSIKIRSF